MKKYAAIALLLVSVALGVNKRHIQPQAKVGPDTILYYKLWAPTTATVAHDYSGNSNDGTATGTSIIPAYPGYDLAGDDEYFDVGASLQSTFRASFTLSIWVKMDDGQPAGQEVVMGVIDAADDDSLMNLAVTAGGEVAFRLTSEGDAGNIAVTDTTPFADGQSPWVHLAAVLDATIENVGGKVIYVNGVLQTLGTDGDTNGVTSASWTSGENLIIGAYNNDGTPAAFVAAIFGETMIFNVAKSAAEIKSIFETQKHRYGI